MITPLIVVLSSLSMNQAPASQHPWVDAQEKKQRYGVTPDPSSPFKGPETGSKVTVNEFADFECPYCAEQEADIKKLLAAYPNEVKFVFKNLPLKIHANARHKAIVAECAGEQGKFWEVHDKMFSGAAPKTYGDGLDQGKYNACLKRGGNGQVDRDLAEAKRLGLASTPSFVIDGIRQGGEIKFEQLHNLVAEEIVKHDAKVAGGGAAPAAGK